jgi:hypothetical protein
MYIVGGFINFVLGKINSVLLNCYFFEIHDDMGYIVKFVVTGVEMFKKLLDQGQAGDNVGLLLRGVEREDIIRGQVLAKAGSIKPHTKFEAEVYVAYQLHQKQHNKNEPHHPLLYLSEDRQRHKGSNGPNLECNGEEYTHPARVSQVEKMYDMDSRYDRS